MIKEISNLEEKAKQIRRDTLELAVEHSIGHIASSLSCVEILVALYYDIMTDDDIFILSKGHGCLSWYAILRDKGYNPTISGHPDIDPENGIMCTTGSLGHGLPVGVGMALAKKLKKEKGRVFVLCGDGELAEGSIWESLLIASHYKLYNLIMIVDNNKLQSLGRVDDILSLRLYGKMIEFIGTTFTVDGHNIDDIIERFDIFSRMSITPITIIAETVKGKGISFMENNSIWHMRLPNNKELKQARKELK